MDSLERELKKALGRKDPPPDFAERVIRQAARGPVAEMPSRRWSRWMAAAAALVLSVGAGLEYRQYRGQVAKEQVMQAVRIASSKVNQIQSQVREAAR